MSKKVRFYMFLDIIGIGLTLFFRFVCINRVLPIITDVRLQKVAVIFSNIGTIAMCLFIVCCFLLYWWSDRKWTKIKQRFKKEG